ncbi:UNVERIFIED_CONTAM: hypothetical protein Scaly_0676700 [Sesamum calycinum]|uniref:RNase H type-1 domain-containing protein n=1 Tax=Sesamum calycinum TaxID=2727403 RepID=A0AAW2R6E9_9LAMI
MAGAPMEEASKAEKWFLHVDGSSTTQGNGAVVVITTPYGEDLDFIVKFGFKASNNEAKCEALNQTHHHTTISQTKSSLEHTSDVFNRRLEDPNDPVVGGGTHP